jgi:S-methylmethionine-dependent homocysteine/selenocysteine methylase
MKILFGPYGCALSSLGISSNALTIKRYGQNLYRAAVELIARSYVKAGATMPTVNAFFLRSLLKEGFIKLYQEMLCLNLEALLAALGETSFGRIAICLGPANDCYQPALAPSVAQAHLFAKCQYELCIEVLNSFGMLISDVVILHETIGTVREALGISQAAQELNMPLIISFIVNRDGFLLSGEPVESAISCIDNKTLGFVDGFSLNCCSPCSFDRVIASFENKNLMNRLIGFYPNSWDTNPFFYETEEERVEPRKTDSLKKIVEKGCQYDLKFVGGCCGFGYHDIKRLASLIAEFNDHRVSGINFRYFHTRLSNHVYI